jgi:hypothetical protein
MRLLLKLLENFPAMFLVAAVSLLLFGCAR